MSDFDFSEINLDFLQSPPKSSSTVNRLPASQTPSKGSRSGTKKRLEWAKKVSNVDILLREIQKIKCDNLHLQTQLKDFQKTALDIQDLYATEKRNNELKTKALEELQRKYENADTELVIKSLKCDQFQACLADQKERPLDYNDLVLKFLRLVHRAEGDECCLRGYQDRSMVEDLKQYCAKFKLKLHIPSANSPQKATKSKAQKITKEDASVQCELLLETPAAKRKPETKNQSTQCQVELRTQGTQHISTMTTRSTTTSCFIKFRNVGTNFPEIQSQPAVDDILKEFAPWQNITPISPLIDQINEELRKSHKTIGTCTWLCNIRRPIDFIPRNKMKRLPSSRPASCDVTTQGAIIKQEVPTPSQSPAPNVPSNENITTTATTIATSMASQSIPAVNSLIGTINTTSQLSQVTNPSFHELWHIFGRMVFGLYTTSNAGIAAVSQESVNQQQFHNWLRELYDSSVGASSLHAPTTETTSTRSTNDQGDMDQHHARETHSVGTSPPRFNESSVLTSTNILRPQARRMYAENSYDSQEMSFDSTQESDHEEDKPPALLSSENTSLEPSTNCNNTAAESVENFNCDSNSTPENEIPNLHSVEEEIKNKQRKYALKASKRRKDKLNMLDDIKEIFPDVKLSKDKRKALKRLLKNNKNKKKSSKDKHIKNNLTSDDVLTSLNHSEEYEAPVETAVDFLKGIFEKGEMSYFNYHMDPVMEDLHTHPFSPTKAEIVTYKENLPKKDDSSEYTGNVGDHIRHDGDIPNYDEMDLKEHDQGYTLSNITFSSANEFMCTNSQSLSHTVAQAELFDKNYTYNEWNQKTHITKLPEETAEIAFSFTRPADKSKKSKYSNKKELYSSLFGDSDTEIEDGTSEEKDFIRISKRNNIPKKAHDSDIELEVNTSTSEYVNVYPNTSSENNHQNSFPYTIPGNDSSENIFRVSVDDEISIPEISTPILQNVERTLMNTPSQSLSLFEAMDKENQHRLESIIDKQLEEKYAYSEDGDACSAEEDISSDLEKDFEISSEEDQGQLEEAQVNDLSKKEDNKSLISMSENQSSNVIITKAAKVIEMSKEANTFERCLDTLNTNVAKETAEANSNISTYNLMNTSHNSGRQDTSEKEPFKSMASNLVMSHVNTDKREGRLKYVTLRVPLAEGMKTISADQHSTGDECSESSRDVANEYAEHNFKKPAEFLALNSNGEIVYGQNKYSESGISSQDLRETPKNITASNIQTSNPEAPEVYGSENKEYITTNSKNISSHFVEKPSVGNLSNITTMNEMVESKFVDKCHKERRKPGKLNIEEEIVFYPNNTIISNADFQKQHISEHSSNCSEITDLHSSQKKVKTENISETPAIDTSSSSTENECSIIEISSDTQTDLERSRDMNSPNDELMIDEDLIDDMNAERKKDNQIMLKEQPSESHQDSKTPIKICSEEEYLPGGSQKTECEIKSPTTSMQTAVDSLNASTVSSILDSTLYKDILTDSMCPIVDEILQSVDEVVLKAPAKENKIIRCGRKRKSDCQTQEYLPPPCKRSERIKAKKIILEQSIKMSISPVEIGKYTRIDRNTVKVRPCNVEKAKEQSEANQLKFLETKIQSKMGYFRETEEKESVESKKQSCNHLTQTLKCEGMSAFVNIIKDQDDIDDITTRKDHSNDSEIINTASDKSLLMASKTNAKQTVNGNTLNNIITISSTDSMPSFYKEFDGIKSSTFKIPTCLSNTSNTNAELSPSDTYSPQSPINDNTREEDSTFDYSESPQSPSEEKTVEYLLNTATLDIPLELSPEYRPQRKQSSLLESLISHYSVEDHNAVSIRNVAVEDTFTNRQKSIIYDYNYVLKEYCCNPMQLDPDILARQVIGKLQKNVTIDYELLYTSILKITKEAEASQVRECELPSIIQEMPPRHLSLTLQRLFYLLKHLMPLNTNSCTELQKKLLSLVFNSQQLENITLSGSLHLAQLYLMTCKFLEPQLSAHPARLFIANCLYYYSIKAIPMILEVLMWYPTVLPPREDPIYDRSDAVITVIQHCLMCTKYDMENSELRGKTLISKLRYEYHYEPYRPSIDEVVNNLVEKIKNSKINDELLFAFGLFCKRLHPIKTESTVLQLHLLPLANEYFNQALQNPLYDSRISALLEIIAIVVKPFPLDWNIDVYLNLFSRFLNSFTRQIIQESAVRSILRLQRFGYVNCFNRLRSFKPNYELELPTQAMFKTFIHRKKLSFLKTVQIQNPINMN